MSNAERTVDWSNPTGRALAILALDPNGRVLMTRDMELVRKILFEIDSWPDTHPRAVRVEGHDDKTVFRHLEMLHEAKLIDVYGSVHRSNVTGEIDQILVTDMSWAGHDFVAALKDASVWNKIKASLSPDQLARMPLEAMKAVAIYTLTEMAKRQIHF